MLNQDSGGNIINIASGKTLSILELAHIVKEVYQEKYHRETPIYLPDNSIANNPNKFKNLEKFMIDITRIKEYGFQPTIDLKTGIHSFFGYLEENY